MNFRPSKLPGVGTTIFTVMSRMAAEHDAINLSQGFPDFDAPPALLELVARHLHQGRNQYAPMPGIQELRNQIAAKTELLYARPTDPDQEVTVTSGATEALFSAINAFVRRGDEVIVFDPAYDAYDPAITLAGGAAVHIPMNAPDYRIDWQRVGEAIGPKTRMIIVNSPHNPTGAVLDSTDLEALQSLVAGTDILLLSDEVYEHIIFDGRKHESLLHYPTLADRCLVVSSFGKTFHATGWKIGYCVAAPSLMEEFRRVHQFVQFCVATPLQYGLADFLATGADHYLELPNFYEKKRDLFCDLLSASRFSLVPSAGTYFQLADYSAISNESDTKFAERLTKEFGVAAIPVSVFCKSLPDRPMLRFCFAKNTSTLERAAEILCKI